MSVLLLADAKTHLNITVTTYDVELQSKIDSAEAVIARRCGPLSSVATTSRVRGGGDALLLTTSPAVSLTSVTPVGGSALTLTDLYLDTVAAVVTYDLGGTFGSGAYTVVYQAGRATVPLDLMEGIKELLRHLWSNSQRGGARRGGADMVNPATYLLPYEVQSLIEPHLQPGFA